MDKVKEYLAVAQKHHFWVICGVVLIASLTCWWLAESKLDKEKTAQEQLIEGKFTSMKGVAGMADHPNDKTTERLRTLVFGIGNNVYDAWVLRYQEQLKVPQWQGDLTKPFLSWIEKNPEDAEIPVRFREEYANFIKTEIASLFKQVNARELVEIPNAIPLVPGAAGNRPPVRGAGNQMANAQVGVTHEWKGLVSWDLALQDELQFQYDWGRRPTSRQVRYANEDLWIYRALLDIIAKTNEGAKEHLVANIKAIEALNIGLLVQPPMQFYVPLAPAPGAAAASGEAPSAEGAAPGGEGGIATQPGVLAPLGAPGAMGAQGGASGEAGGAEGGTGESATAMTADQFEDAKLKHGRYVDAKGYPLAYNAPEPFAEFKIMPFEMRLLMDQRKVPELLANCANSPLPVEVRQVGITSTEQPLTQSGGAGGEGGRQPGMGGMGPRPAGRVPGGEGMLNEGGRGFGGPSRPAAPQRPRPGAEGGAGGGQADFGNTVEMRPTDLYVELRGVIYIFNKPDRNKVGKTQPAPEQPPVAAEAGAG